MSNEKEFEGCLTCDVGNFYGSLNGMNEVACHSAYLESTKYAHLTKIVMYPEWCPLKDKIIKGGNLNV